MRRTSHGPPASTESLGPHTHTQRASQSYRRPAEALPSKSSSASSRPPAVPGEWEHRTLSWATPDYRDALDLIYKHCPVINSEPLSFTSLQSLQSQHVTERTKTHIHCFDTRLDPAKDYPLNCLRWHADTHTASLHLYFEWNDSRLPRIVSGHVQKKRNRPTCLLFPRVRFKRLLKTFVCTVALTSMLCIVLDTLVLFRYVNWLLNYIEIYFKNVLNWILKN